MLHLLKKEINFKKIITIIFIAVLYFGFFVPKSKAVGIVDATLLFNPASTSVSAGSDFNLVARVDPGSNTVDGDGVNAVQLDITFDPDVLQLNSMVAAGTFTRLATPTIDNLLGTASAAFFIAGDDVITVSDVATLSFHAQASATDSPVAFATSANAAVSDGLGTQVVATRTPATVTVTGVSYTVGGTASGLNGTAVLQNNGGNDLNVTANTTFTFTNGLADGATYAVTILTQPTGQTCVLSDESGTISAANVDNVGLTCTTNTYTVTFDGNTSDGGSTATQTLDYNTPTALTANGYTKTGYTFDGWNTLANGTGTDYADEAEYTIGTANVTLYAQWTVITYTVGGTATGLNGTAVLQNNGGDDLNVTGESFTFATGLANGATYAVTIETQPTGQTCTLSNDTGTINLANVTNVGLTCTENSYTVGGTITGLDDTVTLQNNAGDDLDVSVDGAFTFVTSIEHGDTYAVTVLTQPTGQTCSVSDGSGTMGGANVTDVEVTCADITYTIGGTASGLNGTAVLQNNAGDDLNVTEDGSFTFATGLADGATYAVTIETQPTGQTCTLSDESGTISAANVTDVELNCTDTAGPTRSAGSPSGSFSSKTKSKAISLTTNEDATCKYSTTSGTEYDSMTETFTTTGETSHSTTVTGLSSNHTYRYYVRCQGESSNVNSTDYAISFSVKKKSSSDEKEPEKRKLSTNKKVLQRGEVIIESGKRFSKNDYVQLYFQTRYGGAFYPPVTVKTSDKGTFSISYKIPWYKSPGIYKWYAVDLKTGRTSKQGRYIVQ